jgi:hypothetical protein
MYRAYRAYTSYLAEEKLTGAMRNFLRDLAQTCCRIAQSIAQTPRTKIEVRRSKIALRNHAIFDPQSSLFDLDELGDLGVLAVANKK